MTKQNDKKKPSDIAGEVAWNEMDSVIIVGRKAGGGIWIHGAGLQGGEGVYLSQFLAQYLISKEIQSALKAN